MTNSKKQSEDKPARRAKFRCPPELKRVIGVINSITDEAIQEFYRTDVYDYEHPPEWSEVFDELPKIVQDYLLENIGGEKSQPFAYRRGSWVFQNLISFRNLVNHIEFVGRESLARANGEELSPKMIADVETSLNDPINPLMSEKFAPGTIEDNDLGVIQFRVSPNRRLKLKVSPLLGVLDEVDVTRIRRCEFCEDIFWAERIDALGCSPRCSNGLRQRKLRGAGKGKAVKSRTTIRKSNFR